MRKLFGEKLPRVSFDDCERAKRAKRPLSTLVEIAPFYYFIKRSYVDTRVQKMSKK